MFHERSVCDIFLTTRGADQSTSFTAGPDVFEARLPEPTAVLRNDCDWVRGCEGLDEGEILSDLAEKGLLPSFLLVGGS